MTDKKHTSSLPPDQTDTDQSTDYAEDDTLDLTESMALQPSSGESPALSGDDGKRSDGDETFRGENPGNPANATTAIDSVDEEESILDLTPQTVVSSSRNQEKEKIPSETDELDFSFVDALSEDAGDAADETMTAEDSKVWRNADTEEVGDQAADMKPPDHEETVFMTDLPEDDAEETDEDETVLDLADVAPVAAQETDDKQAEETVFMTDLPEDDAEEADEDETVLDLADVVPVAAQETGDKQAEETVFMADLPDDDTEDADEGVIDLTEMAPDAAKGTVNADEETIFPEDEKTEDADDTEPVLDLDSLGAKPVMPRNAETVDMSDVPDDDEDESVIDLSEPAPVSDQKTIIDREAETVFTGGRPGEDAEDPGEKDDDLPDRLSHAYLLTPEEPEKDEIATRDNGDTLTALEILDGLGDLPPEEEEEEDPIGLIDVLDADVLSSDENDFLDMIESHLQGKPESGPPAEKEDAPPDTADTAPAEETAPSEAATEEPAGAAVITDQAGEATRTPVPELDEDTTEPAPAEKPEPVSGPAEPSDTERISPEEVIVKDGRTFISVSPEEMEAALERVVTRIFSEKIEKIITAEIQNVVREEFMKFKSLLIEEDTDGYPDGDNF